MSTDAGLRKQRQVIFWRLLAAVNGQTEQARNVEQMTREIVGTLGMPELVLDPVLAVDTLVQRYPELKANFESLRAVCNPEPAGDGETPAPPPVTGPLSPQDLRPDLCYSKLLLNVFGPNTMGGTVTAQQYAQWCKDVGTFEQCFGYAPGQLRGKRGQPSASASGTGTGGLISAEQLQAGLAS